MVVVIDAKNPYLADALAAVAEVRVLPTPAITRSALRDADAVIVRSETPIGSSLLEGTPVRFVGTATIGTDHVDTEYLASHGIAFASAPGSNANSVAEYVAAGLLVLGERLGVSLAGRTLGVIGVGNVGSRIARVGKALGMSVLLNDPPRARSTGDPAYLPLEALFDADVITLHVPLTREGLDPTFHLVNASFLSRMKRGSILINTSRGGVADSPALAGALRDGSPAAAVLDVWENEPAIDIDLLSRTALATPHIAGYSLDGKVNAARMMFEGLATHFGFEESWPPPAHLPPPAHVELDVRDHPATVDTLRRIITSCYAIEQDDAGLRALSTLPPDERGDGFRALRAHYRVRREFPATSVVLTPSHAPLQIPLTLLGFSLREESGVGTTRSVTSHKGGGGRA